jgi:2',3'-cyclic-nucleotide 2'-phosphodiesterase
MLKIVFFGDISAEPGRKVLKKNLPAILESEKPDLVLANVENLAHGKGVTIKTLEELIRAGVSGFTAGNHIFSKREFSEETLKKYSDRLVRPVNISNTFAGSEAAILQTAKGDVLIGNFLGQVFMENQFHDPISSPFTAAEEWLNKYATKKLAAILVDFHAEATSEKVAFGYFLDGKITALLGTHTHIPTADAKVLSGGTAYITDVGMCGAADTVLGVKKELSLERFTTGVKVAFDVPEDPLAGELSYVIIEVDESTAKATNIRSVHRIVPFSS